MANEKDKFISSASKTFGYAFFTPLASMLFQWIVFEKSLQSGHIFFALVSFLVGWLFVGFGYIILREN